MRKLEYQVSFTTPSFLGNAQQTAQWRTPPFKALIRHWWRLVKAPEVGFDIGRLRKAEGRVFGVAADDGDSRRSLVRLRLSDWGPGTLTSWGADDKVPHKEVAKAGKIKAIGAQLYLGFGPLATSKGKTVLSQNPVRTAIAPGQSKTLTITVPDNLVDEMVRALQLCAWFGAIGSRSRNGWGAVQFKALGETPSIPDLEPARLSELTRPLDECLKLSWPHAIGIDDQNPLVWQTQVTPQSSMLMHELAAIKIEFRTDPALMSFDGVPQGKFAPRHLLAYPVTHHSVNGQSWGSQGRLANQLRFKALATDGGWVGIIVHTPCRLPETMVADLPQPVQANLDPVARAAWRQVHAILDAKAQRMNSHG